MFSRVDSAGSTALYLQVAGQIRRSIAEGDAKLGERLPAARDLAAVMGVNTNTVLRSLRMLRDEGLVEFRRGMGARVSGTPTRIAIVDRASELLAYARDHGYERDELVRIVQGLS